jgi:hypothetical protein
LFLFQFFNAHLQDLAGLSLDAICLTPLKFCLACVRNSGFKGYSTFELFLKSAFAFSALKKAEVLTAEIPRNSILLTFMAHIPSPVSMLLRHLASQWPHRQSGAQLETIP